ncbi:MAG: NAD(P)/FAD-dependent oxidoreductase [Anaerolineae bacterium]|nr:NAD(P)/FAD-dependent oxidoreductase [Anaerolineae bacterium]
MLGEQAVNGSEKKRYDVIIVGASFAGLAVAAQLRNKRVLVLDRKPIGTGQTSACGTPLHTLQALGLDDAVLQVHERIVVHTPGRDFVYPLAEPFCTFDYFTLCQRLWQRADADFVQGAALEVQSGSVRTTQGVFHSAMTVDASGWRAALARHLQPDMVRRDRLNFGLETSVSHPDYDLHFGYDPRLFSKMDVSWAFPAGESNRVGLASYSGDSHLADKLDALLADLDLQPNEMHGGFLPHSLREPIVGDVFLVGDAAGQCLGLTGEGIRPALYFGTYLGGLLCQVLESDLTLAQARDSYRKQVAERKVGYEWLCRAQRVLPRLPLPLVRAAMAVVSQPIVLKYVLARYMQAFQMSEAVQVIPSGLK